MDCSTPSFPVLHQLPELAQTYVHLVRDVIHHFILCGPLLLLPSISPSIRVFSNKSVLCIRWPKFWSFSFSISPSNEYSGLISFRIEWFDLLVVQGPLKSLLQHHSSKHQFFGTSALSLSSPPFLILFLPIPSPHSLPPFLSHYGCIPPFHTRDRPLIASHVGRCNVLPSLLPAYFSLM